MKFDPPSLKQILIFVFILVASFLFRSINLDTVPVFADEAIYVRWSQVMRAEPTLRFLPLSDGKQPLFMWLTIPMFKLVSDPLLAARLLSVIAGTLSILMVSVLAWATTSSFSISIISGLTLAIIPYTFFFDRFALVDSLLSFFCLSSLTFSVFSAKFKRLDLAMIAGFALGFALLTKSPAFFFIPMTLLCHLFLSASPKKYFLYHCILALSTVSIALGMYSVLKLGPEFHLIAQRNRDYIYPLAEILSHPLSPFFPNLRSTIGFFWFFFTPPVLITAIVSLLKPNRKTIFFLLCILTPLCFQVFVARTVTARYFLYLSPYVVILFAMSFDSLKRASLSRLLPSIFIWPLLTTVTIPFSPTTLSLPRSERSGYFELWTSGYGIKSVSQYLSDRSQLTPHILVGTEGFFGTLPNGLEIYLNHIPKIKIIGVGLDIKEVPAPLTNSLKDNEVYFVINSSRLEILPQDYKRKGLRLIGSYPKAAQPDGRIEHLLFFQVFSP